MHAQVTVSVAKSTVDSTGHPRVAREWDNGVAQVSLDSTGYVRIDEGCRGVGCNNQTPGECAGCDAHAAEASGTYASGVPPVKLSSALGMSGAAVSAELGNKTRDWTVVSMLARTGISWARYAGLRDPRAHPDALSPFCLALFPLSVSPAFLPLRCRVPSPSVFCRCRGHAAGTSTCHRRSRSWVRAAANAK